MNIPKVVYRDLASGRLLSKQEATERDPSTWVVEKIIAPNTSESDEHKRWDLPEHLDS